MSRKKQAKLKEAVELQPRRRFLEGLLAQTEGKTELHYRLLPSSPDFLVANSGVGGLSFRFVVGMDSSRVELYIASSNVEANERLFNELLLRKGGIKEGFRERLSWERLEGKKSCRVTYRLKTGGAAEEANWQVTQTTLVDAMVRFERTLLPLVRSLK